MSYARFFLLLLALVSLSGCASPDAVSTAAAGPTVGYMVNELKHAANDVTNSMDISFGNNLFRARQHLELLLGRLEAISTEVPDLLFSELEDAERRVFYDVQELLDGVAALERVTAEDVNTLVNGVSSSLANLPFYGGMPLVLESSPLYVHTGGSFPEEGIEFHVQGVLLAGGEPALTIDGGDCRRTGSLETSLRFRCPRELFGTVEELGSAVGKLSVFGRRSLWERVTLVRAPRYEYEMSLTIVPSLLGQAIPYVDQRVERMYGTERSQSFSHRNSHCSGVRHPEFAFNAQEEAVIDASSIALECKKSEKSTCQGVRNIQPKSFAVACTVENRGSCAPDLPIVGRAFVDARGSCWGVVTWREFERREQVEEQVRLPALDVHWGRQERLELPEGTESVTIVVEQINGERVILTEGRSREAWVDLEVGVGRRQAVLRPRRLSAAMAQ